MYLAPFLYCQAMLWINKIFALSILLMVVSCSEEESAELVLPSNLAVNIEISADIDGLVDFKATALNANYFSFYLEDGESLHQEESLDGNLSYTYLNTGRYLVKVRAHATASQFIEWVDSITLDRAAGSSARGIPTTGYTTPLSYDNYSLVWNDEFDGKQLNTDYWNFELGTGEWGWGNNELQYYLRENVSVRDGYLSITAKEQQVANSAYTSSRITTQTKKFFKYGRVDIRAAMPAGKGIWPALWMLGESHASIGWPKCGEIDIMEMVGGNGVGLGDNKVHGTAHWDANGQYASSGNSYILSQGKLADEFHVYSIIWDSQLIEWYIDDVKYNSLSITGSDMSEFQEEFFFLFNVAVGGNWPGSPDQTTSFPQSMHVDYLRVFQKL